MPTFIARSGSFNDLQITGSSLSVISSSVYFNNLTTSSTTVSNVLMISSSGQVFITASSAIGGGGGSSTPTSFIATGSVTASVNVGTGNVFTIASASTNLMTVSSSGLTRFITSPAATNVNRFIINNGTSDYFGVASANSFAAVFSSFSSSVLSPHLSIGSGVTIISPASAIGDHNNIIGGAVLSSSLFRINRDLTTVNLDVFSNGNVKIGNTTTDLGYRLAITGSGTSGSFNANNILFVSGSIVSISGSLTVVSGSTEFQVLGTGVKIGNAATDTHTVTGSLLVDSTLYVTQSKVGVGTGTIAPVTTFQVNGGIVVGQSGNNMNQRIDFVRASDGAVMTGISAGNGIIQIGGGNLNFVDIYAANAYVARFSEVNAGAGTPALNLKGPLFVSGAGYTGTVDYMLDVTGSGDLGSFRVNNTLITSGSFTILPQVSSSLNFVDDTAAAAGGVPLGGLYRNGNVIQIRLA